MKLIRAAYVAPVDRPAIEDGAVLVDGETIMAVGPASELSRGQPHAEKVDLGRCLLLPGLVNAHTHLELSDRQPAPRVASFADWITAMAASGRSLPPPEQRIPAAAAEGARECLRFGVTTVGDISQFPALSRPAIADTGLRAVSFAEALGLGEARARFETLLEQGLSLHQPPGRIQPGLSPHAPYTVDADGYRQALAIARQRGWPLATHLAESREEALFVQSATGPFRELWERLGSWRQNASAPFNGSPIALGASVGLLDWPRSLLAHVNYADDADLNLLANGKASIVWCPRTHAYFDHPPHRFREMLGRGINVCIGTDSRASSPDLNLLDDLRLIYRADPHVSPDLLLELVTLRGAKALGLDQSVGSLTPGKQADLVAFPTPGARSASQAAGQLLAESILPSAMWIAGDLVR